MKSNWIITLSLSLSLVAFSCDYADARPRGGGKRGGAKMTQRSGAGAGKARFQSRRGNADGQRQRSERRTQWRQGEGRQGEGRQGEGRQRSYQGTRTNSQGDTSSVNGHRTWKKTGEGRWERSGSQTRVGADGKERSRSYEGAGTRERTDKGVSKTYDGTRTNAKGETHNVNAERQWQKTGEGTYERSGSKTVTGPDGTERTKSYEGSGTVQKTETGVSKTYEGTRTNAKGETVDVSRTKDVTKGADGSVTVDKSRTVTNEAGATFNGESTTTRNGDGTFERSGTQTLSNPEGVERTRSYEGTGSVEKTETGRTRTYEGTRTNGQGETFDVSGNKNVNKDEDGSVTVDSTRTVTNEAGESKTTTGERTWTPYEPLPADSGETESSDQAEDVQE